MAKKTAEQATGQTESAAGREAPDPTTAPMPAPTLASGPTVSIVTESKNTTDPEATKLLLAACEIYGINPDARLPVYRPSLRGDGPFRELLAWTFYPSDRMAGIPSSVCFVTAGGLKLVHFTDPDYPMDAETDEKLARIFHAFERQKDGSITRLSLPANLTLPPQQCDGRARTSDHVYQRGYLREGGKTEADKRAGQRKDTTT